ncbi:hypothetical protein ACFL6C_01255 [Myxococcota bacterium]
MLFVQENPTLRDSSAAQPFVVLRPVSDDELAGLGIIRRVFGLVPLSELPHLEDVEPFELEESGQSTTA